jgi:hypothetical protein
MFRFLSDSRQGLLHKMPYASGAQQLVWLPTVTSSDSILPIDRDGNEMAHIVRTIVGST